LKLDDGATDKLAGKQEVTFYTSIAGSMPDPPAVPCYHAAYDSESGAYHLLLEDVSETHRTVHPEEPALRRDMEHILDALARLHAYWWNHPRLGEEIGTLPTAEWIEQDFEKLGNAFAGFVDFLGDRLSEKRRDIYEQVLARFPDALGQHLTHHQRLTVVHNDAHTGNFLLPREPETQASYLVDWQQWGAYNGTRDVAYLIALFWYPERRARMEQTLVREYHNQLQAYGVTGYDWDACWNDYRHHAIENLFVPLWAWIYQGRNWGYHRWHQLEKAMLAFEDLGCVEFLK
jgi:thiamine kinase-like enzyme